MVCPFAVCTLLRCNIRRTLLSLCVCLFSRRAAYAAAQAAAAQVASQNKQMNPAGGMAPNQYGYPTDPQAAALYAASLQQAQAAAGYQGMQQAGGAQGQPGQYGQQGGQPGYPAVDQQYAGAYQGYQQPQAQ